MKDFTQWTPRQVISLIPRKKRKRKRINEEGQDQQPEATLNASCKLFQCSHTVLLYVGLPSSSQQRLRMKTAASPRCCSVDGVPPPLRRWWVLKEETGGARLYPLSSFAACSSALSEAAEPSNLWEAMAAWWDMLFLTTSPFLHSVISCTGEGAGKRKRSEVWRLYVYCWY